MAGAYQVIADKAAWDDVTEAAAHWTAKNDEWLVAADSVLNPIGDAVWKPLDSSALGWVDRGAAVLNVDVVAAESSNALDEVPAVGDIVIAADGLYFAADYLAHPWTGIEHGVENTAGAVGHATITAVHRSNVALKTLTSWL